jgi:hypothetical protein
MAISTFEGTVENGQIRLLDDVELPEHAKVYVILPDLRTQRPARIYSPRLAHPEQAADFTMKVVEEQTDAEV